MLGWDVDTMLVVVPMRRGVETSNGMHTDEEGVCLAMREVSLNHTDDSIPEIPFDMPIDTRKAAKLSPPHTVTIVAPVDGKLLLSTEEGVGRSYVMR
mmetsp:Transcript_50272/g.118061  ORF Transcript_50272/g.118061 Transcript_50272/m.118061 type:complete len:97 (-) Transcript_50272:4-294(-)